MGLSLQRAQELRVWVTANHNRNKVLQRMWMECPCVTGENVTQLQFLQQMPDTSSLQRDKVQAQDQLALLLLEPVERQHIPVESVCQREATFLVEKTPGSPSPLPKT